MLGRRVSVTVGAVGTVLLLLSAVMAPGRSDAGPRTYREAQAAVEAADADAAAEPLPAPRLHTYSNVPAPLPPRDAAMHRRWKEAEPGLEHVVLRDAECDRALGQYFPKVPRGAGSMSFALRAAVCGLVAVWHDGGYYVHRDVAPNASVRRPITRLFPSGRGVVVLDDAGSPALWFFGAARRRPCVAHALSEIGGLLQSHRVDGATFGVPDTCDDGSPRPAHAPPGVLRDLLTEGRCRGAHGAPSPAAEFSRGVSLPDLSCSPLAATLTFVSTAHDVPSAAAEARWEAEERRAAVRRLDAAMCGSLTEAAAGRPVAGLDPAAAAFVCALLAVKDRGGIAVADGVEWVRPASTWLPPEAGLVVAKGADGSIVPGFAAAPQPSECADAAVAEVSRALSEGPWPRAQDLAGRLPACTTTLGWPASGGDAFLARTMAIDSAGP